MKVFQNGVLSGIKSGLSPPPGLNASAQHWLQGDREMPVTSTISVVDDSIAVLPFSKAACF